MLQEPLIPASTLPAYCSDGTRTASLLNEWTAQWHVDEHGHMSLPWEGSTDGLHHDGLLAELHSANFELWHLEDDARDPFSADAVVAQIKRAIDKVNQRRNDTVEAIDRQLLAALAEHRLPRPEARLHSETPGQMLDRLSILALKIFHTAVESERAEADEEHRVRNTARLQLLREQQADLAGCLQEVWQRLLDGSLRFKQYRQFKMYNDATLNPVLYSGLRVR